MEATRMIDHKWPYNENLSRPQSCLVLGRPPRRFRRAGLNKRDRKSTRLNSSHLVISYAVFCLKKKKKDSANLLASSPARVVERLTRAPSPRGPTPFLP